MIIETVVPFEELEEIRRKSGAEVKLTFLKTLKRNGIPLNRVLVEGLQRKSSASWESPLARAGG